MRASDVAEFRAAAERDRAPGYVADMVRTLLGVPEEVRLLVRLARADPAAPLMFRRHLLQHENRRMMGQALVLDPGQRPAFGPAGSPGHDHGGGGR